MQILGSIGPEARGLKTTEAEPTNQASGDVSLAPSGIALVVQ